MSEEDRFTEYPEIVSFEGIGKASLRQIHLIAVSLIALGLVFVIFAPPGGYIILGLFIAIAAAYDMIFMRKSQRPVNVSLYLRKDPVEALYGDTKLGEIRIGSIVVNMENPNELGYRPEPEKGLFVWIFDSKETAKIVAKRLSMYLKVED